MKLGPRDENSAMTGACSVPILVICGAILPIGFLQCEEKEEDCCNIISFSSLFVDWNINMLENDFTW
jgi:hypothetical protein